MMPQPALMRALGYAGLIPFLAAALALWWLEGALSGLAQRVFLVYSLAILCFLGGTLWGSAAAVPAPQQAARVLLSNFVVIVGVCCVLLAESSPLAATLGLLGAHLLQLGYELRHPLSWSGYLALRTQLSLTAAVAHLLVIGALLVRGGASVPG
jgi:hypothetical protein